MSKKILALLAGYVAGSVVTSLYAEKKWTDVKKDIEKAKKGWEDGVHVFLSYLFNIHKKFFWEVKENVVNPENKQFVQNKAKEVIDLVQEYKIEGQKLIASFEKTWKTYATSVVKALDDFSKMKTDEAELKLKDLWNQAISEFKKSTSSILRQLKSQKPKKK